MPLSKNWLKWIKTNLTKYVLLWPYDDADVTFSMSGFQRNNFKDECEIHLSIKVESILQAKDFHQKKCRNPFKILTLLPLVKSGKCRFAESNLKNKSGFRVWYRDSALKQINTCRKTLSCNFLVFGQLRYSDKHFAFTWLQYQVLIKP